MSIYYDLGDTYIKTVNEATRSIDIILYEISGKKIQFIEDKVYEKGTHSINVKEEINRTLSPGMYICKVYSDDMYSAKLIIS